MKTIKELELSLIVKEAMIQQLKLKNNLLEEKINKAIEYITKHTNNGMFELRSDTNEIEELLDILKGDDK